MIVDPASVSDLPPAEAIYPASGGDHEAFRITSRETLLSAVPYLLGFQPDASMVIIGAKGAPESVHLTQRLPLPRRGEPALIVRSAGHAIRVLAAQECTAAFAVGYGPEAAVAPFAGHFRDMAAEQHITVREILRVSGGRYWPCACTASCRPPEGVPYTPTAEPALAALLAEGVPGVLASRDGLAALVAPVTGAEATAMQQATRRARARRARLLSRPAKSDAGLSGYALAAAEGVTAVKAAMDRFRHGGALTAGEAAWLTVAMRDARIRDDFRSRWHPKTVSTTCGCCAT
jgi:hypothetical protein